MAAWPAPITAGKELAKVKGVGKGSMAKIDEVGGRRDAGGGGRGREGVGGWAAFVCAAGNAQQRGERSRHATPAPQFLKTGTFAVLTDDASAAPKNKATEQAMAFV